MVITNEKEFFKEHYKSVMQEPCNLNAPNSIRLSSDLAKESVYNMRNLMRQNMICHKKFIPTLDCLSFQKLYKGVYEPNQPDDEVSILKPVSRFIVENGNYKDASVKVYELFTRSDCKKGKHKLNRSIDARSISIQSSPKVCTQKLMRDL